MITLNWSGYKKLTPENIEVLPTLAGVYKLTTYNAQTREYNRPFYVGQTDNIKARTQQHVSPNELNSCIKDKIAKYLSYINYAFVPRQEDRDATEVVLYNHYQSECNDQDALPNVKPADLSSFN